MKAEEFMEKVNEIHAQKEIRPKSMIMSWPDAFELVLDITEEIGERANYESWVLDIVKRGMASRAAAPEVLCANYYGVEVYVAITPAVGQVLA